MFLKVSTLVSLGAIFPIGAFIYGMLSNVRTLAKSYPVRFNRQRREVCYIDDTTHRVLIVPWESVVAWVARSQGVTSYGVMRDYTFGMGLELNVIAAAVIGGASLKGGSGTVLGAVLGLALLSVVTSSLILLDVSPYWQDVIKGLILLVAVTIDHLLNVRKTKR